MRTIITTTLFSISIMVHAATIQITIPKGMGIPVSGQSAYLVLHPEKFPLPKHEISSFILKNSAFQPNAAITKGTNYQLASNVSLRAEMQLVKFDKRYDSYQFILRLDQDVALLRMTLSGNDTPYIPKGLIPATVTFNQTGKPVLPLQGTLRRDTNKNPKYGRVDSSGFNVELVDNMPYLITNKDVPITITFKDG